MIKYEKCTLKKGIILFPKWADLILDGYKDLEIRGSDTKHRGITGIIKSKSKNVFGTTNLKGTIKLTKEIFENTRDRHLLDMSWEELLKIYPNPWAWNFAEPKKFKEPIPYIHKLGCVIWVNL